MTANARDSHWIASEFSPLELRISEQTGLPTALRSDPAGLAIEVEAEASMVVGGGEERHPLGGLAYPGAQHDSRLRIRGDVTSQLVPDGRAFTVPVELGGWLGEATYTFRADTPALTWSWTWRPGTEARELRSFGVHLALRTSDTGNWLVNAPGNRLRRDLPLHDLPESTSVAPIGGTGGSVAVLTATETDSAATVVLWPRSRDEIGGSRLSVVDGELRLSHETGLAAAALDGVELRQDGIALDVLGQDWDEVGRQVPRWFDDLGIRTPTDAPSWTTGATIYEAQIGTSIFAGGSWTYSPYPTVADLYADLPRVAELGFDTIQVMPHQPFPSYNVMDYDDVDLSYGDEVMLKRVIDWCHARGIKVILDVLLHGVIDQESITEAADAVRRGDWADLVRADAEQIDRLKLTDIEQRDLSWSRHILDFEQAWHEGSPKRHPLCEAHPEWFCTDTVGRIIGIYTKAFDMANPQWQDYFSDAMASLVQRLGIDGFRFDAPTYNSFPNWSARTRSRASLQPLGSVGLFARLRRRLHAIDPELMMYTEPNGPLLRQSMDLNYNYDETWLPAALFNPDDPRYTGGVHSGADLARWLQDRDRTLPTGSVTAHHIDSHDTFWWPMPGRKWRREQFGIDAARALMQAFALSGGPYMMFVGGEIGMEESITRVNTIRRQRPELAHGSHDFGAPRTEHAELFTVTHHLPESWSTVIVNMSSSEVEAELPGLRDVAGPITDLLLDAQHPLDWDPGEPLAFGPYQARVLTGEAITAPDSP